MYNKIKVFLVEDHQVVSEGIQSFLQFNEDIDFIGSAKHANECLAFIKTSTCDVILLDINLPDIDGIELCKLIKKTNPEISIIGLSVYNHGSYVRNMMESGSSGYLLKNASKEEIILAIREVFSGNEYFTLEAKNALNYLLEQQNNLPKLTKREKEVLKYIIEGLTNKQISDKLFISIDTVDTHRKNLYIKLQVNNTAMLIRFVSENRIL